MINLEESIIMLDSWLMFFQKNIDVVTSIKDLKNYCQLW